MIKTKLVMLAVMGVIALVGCVAENGDDEDTESQSSEVKKGRSQGGCSMAQIREAQRTCRLNPGSPGINWCKAQKGGGFEARCAGLPKSYYDD